jgi:peptidoglycan/xylan/chitin deacetylase (PgdA/CDA1 family)
MKSIWLTYHDIYDIAPNSTFPTTATTYHISIDQFTQHLDVIRQSSKKVITASEYLAGGITEDTVVLTFDDGWLGVSEYAFARLQSRGFNATLFVTWDFLGRKGFLGKKDLMGLIAKGLDVGIHGTTHRMLSSCSLEEVVWEFSTCKDNLEALVNRPVTIASLPGGDLNNTVIAGGKKAGIQAFCTSIPGFNSENTALYFLKRVSIRHNTSVKDIRRYARFGLSREILRWALFEIPHKTLGGKNYVLFRRWLLKEKNKGEKIEIFDP